MPIPMTSITMYNASSPRNDHTAALPATLVVLARVESTTAPSIPMKIQTVVNIVPLTCERIEPAASGPQKLATKMLHLKALAKITARIITRIGMIFAITAIMFTVTASLTPRAISMHRSHKMILAVTHDIRFEPLPNPGMNLLNVVNKSAMNAIGVNAALSR